MSDYIRGTDEKTRPVLRPTGGKDDNPTGVFLKGMGKFIIIGGVVIGLIMWFFMAQARGIPFSGAGGGFVLALFIWLIALGIGIIPYSFGEIIRILYRHQTQSYVVMNETGVHPDAVPLWDKDRTGERETSAWERKSYAESEGAEIKWHENIGRDGKEIVFDHRPTSQIVCPNCGQKQIAKMKTCYNCGIKFVFRDEMPDTGAGRTAQPEKRQEPRAINTFPAPKAEEKAKDNGWKPSEKEETRGWKPAEKAEAPGWKPVDRGETQKKPESVFDPKPAEIPEVQKRPFRGLEAPVDDDLAGGMAPERKTRTVIFDDYPTEDFICPGCGRRQSPRQKFCSFCGTKFIYEK